MVEICQKIYEKFGQDAVINFCDSVGWGTWAYCEPCEFESPVTDEPDSKPACLVCGSDV